MKWIAKINGKRARTGRTYQRRVIRIPRVASVSGGQDSGNGRSTRANPGVPPTLCCDASATRREGGFPRQRWRHIVADVLPGRSVGGAQIREHSIHRVAVCNAPLRRPEREAVVESIRILVLELNRPGRAAVLCLVDAKVRWISGRSYGHQIGDVGAEGLHIAELQRFGARHDAGFPRLSAVSGDGERASATGRPDHARVHRPDRDQTVGSAAVLRSQCGLMKTCWRELLRAEDSAGERRNKESGERWFNMVIPPKKLFASSIGALRTGSNLPLRPQRLWRTSLRHSRRMR